MVRKGVTYRVTHKDKGTCLCQIRHVDTRWIYGTIIKYDNPMYEESVGDDIRITNKSKIEVIK